MSPGTNPPPPSPASFSTPGSIPPPPSVPPHSSGPTGWPTTKAPSLIDDAHDACKGWGGKRGFSKNGNGSGGRTVCLRGLSFSEFIVLMSTINCEKDNPLGQTVLPPEPFLFFENPRFFVTTLYLLDRILSRNLWLETLTTERKLSRNFWLETFKKLLV